MDENTKSLVIDKAKLQYVSSAGIRQLVAVYRKMDGQVVIKNASAELLDIFYVTGLDKMIRVEGAAKAGH